MIIEALNHYYDNNVKHKPSAAPARRAIHLVSEYLAEKLGRTARVSAFAAIRQREFMRWCVEKHGHTAGTIARNLSVVSASFNFGKALQLVHDGFGNAHEILLLESAPDVITQAAEVARLTELPDSRAREWMPSYEQLGAFIDAIGPRQENLFRYVILGLNTWARPEAILDFRVSAQVNLRFGVLDLNLPGRRQTTKYRPKIRLTDNLAGWLQEWSADAPLMHANEPVTTMKQTFKRHARALGLPLFTQYTLRHFMATELRRVKPPVSKEQRDVWLGHGDQRTASRWYEHNDPEFLEEAKRGTEAVLEELQRHTSRSLFARKSRAKEPLRIVSGTAKRGKNG